MRDVACPIVRQGGRILAFQHPLAGVQLVKGGIEPSETPEAAALRELAEEAGVQGREARLIEVVELAERWHLVAVETVTLPEAWEHHCDDDGGHVFAFFWTDGTGFKPPFSDVLERIV